MKLIEFIKDNSDWKEKLSGEPYYLKIREDEGYTIFSYNQIVSDFYNPIVKEARGVILDLSGTEPRVVCRAFDKFANYGEGYADAIDWDSARVQEKVDGSIIKVWFDKNNWHISSNNCIDAFKAELVSNYTIGDLFVSVFNDFVWDKMDKEYTYIFELVSPYNRVVIDYKIPKLYLIGKRHNASGAEVIPENDLPFARPIEYKLFSLRDCVAAAEALNPGKEIVSEGYVVVDKNFHRVKIKSPAYVAEHHFKTKKPSFEDLVLVYQRKEVEEFLTYFPVYKPEIEKIEIFMAQALIALIIGKGIWENCGYDKKEFALQVKDKKLNYFMFEGVKYNDWSIERILNLPHQELARLIKNYCNSLD